MAQKSPCRYQTPRLATLQGVISERMWASEDACQRGVLCCRKSMKTEKIFSGIAGEYFVAGELSRRGFIAAVTLRNTAGVDIVASNEHDSVNIQVKTRTVERTDNSWQMGSKPLEIKKAWRKSFYVFVAIHSNTENQNIDYYVIPKNLLNRKMENIVKRFLKKSKRTHQTLEKCRRVLFLDGRYSFPELKKLKNRWDIIFSRDPMAMAKKIIGK